jgi:hypothetical protein
MLITEIVMGQRPTQQHMNGGIPRRCARATNARLYPPNFTLRQLALAVIQATLLSLAGPTAVQALSFSSQLEPQKSLYRPTRCASHARLADVDTARLWVCS